MAKEEFFPEVFARLKGILEPYESTMVLKGNTNEHYYLDTFMINPINNKAAFFGSAIIKKNYVSFYLMPVYAFPELLVGISEPLRKRMQGKSCFNFKEINEELLKELEQLTRKG